MIVGVDTTGSAYAALTQVNTDSDMMVTFLYRLSVVLNKEDANWRTNTVLLLDGASYHRSPDTRQALKRIGANYVISGPYSYDAAVAEYYFSYFKRVDLNPTKEPTGKKYVINCLTLFIETFVQLRDWCLTG